MNRLSPLIVRRADPFLPDRTGTVRGMAEGSAVSRTWDPASFEGAEPARWLEELKLFATGWVGGLVFFGTYLG